MFIDDATGRLTGLRFAASETAHGYLELLRAHVLAHGLPLALYSDRHGIFRVNAKDVEKGDGKTAFNRVTERLGIEQICASTPQAKGRVERANQTLQDRLVRELRLAGISDMAAAQAFLAGFMARFNARFSVQPRVCDDAHRGRPKWPSLLRVTDAGPRADDATYAGAGVRKPAGKEPAGSGALLVPLPLWGLRLGALVGGDANDQQGRITVLGASVDWPATANRLLQSQRFPVRFDGFNACCCGAGR